MSKPKKSKKGKAVYVTVNVYPTGNNQPKQPKRLPTLNPY